MDYATIPVHLDASRRTHQRLHIAIALAQQFHATLVGLFTIGHADPGSVRYLIVMRSPSCSNKCRSRTEVVSVKNRRIRRQLRLIDFASIPGSASR